MVSKETDMLFVMHLQQPDLTQLLPVVLHSAAVVVVVGASVRVTRLPESPGDLVHGGKVLLSLAGLLQNLKGDGVVKALEVGLDGVAVGPPLLNERRLSLGGSGGGLLCSGRLGGGLASGGGLRVLALALAALDRSGLRSTAGVRCSRHVQGRAVVIVDTSHVVPQVPVAGEAAARDGAVASLVVAKVGLVTVAVHGVSLALVAEQAGSGGEASVLAGVDLAAVGLQVGVDKFVIVALELLGLVVAGVTSLPWAVEEAISLRQGVLVEWVVTGSRLTVAGGATAESRAHDRVLQEFVSVELLSGIETSSRVVAHAKVCQYRKALRCSRNLVLTLGSVQ